MINGGTAPISPKLLVAIGLLLAFAVVSAILSVANPPLALVKERPAGQTTTIPDPNRAAIPYEEELTESEAELE